MFHYLYITTHGDGRYYVGRHSTKNMDDGYLGSGKWVRSIKDRSSLQRMIVDFFDNEEELKSAEKTLISEHITNSKCMNFNNESCGFSSGGLNPSKREDIRLKSSQRWIENNPVKNGHKEDTKKKISESMTGNKNPFYGKKHTDETKAKISTRATGRIVDDSLKQKLSEASKKSYESGREPTKYWFGKLHDSETKSKMSLSAKNRKRVTCEHCGIEAAVNTYSRWHGDKCKNNLDR